MPIGVYDRGLSPQDRFWRNIDKNGRENEHISRCWKWCGTKNEKGYGKIYVIDKPIKAHRYSYALQNPYGITLDEMEGCDCCHECDNRECCNPDHLFLGDRHDNIYDKCNKNRQVKGEKCRSAKLNEAQVIEIRNRYRNEKISYSKLATEYEVTRTIISRIIRNIAWKHLTTPDDGNQSEP